IRRLTTTTKPDEKDLEARLAGPFRANRPLLFEKLFHALFGLGKVRPHKDLSDELAARPKHAARNLERAEKELEALGLIGFARSRRVRRHVREHDVVRSEELEVTRAERKRIGLAKRHVPRRRLGERMKIDREKLPLGADPLRCEERPRTRRGAEV